MPVMVTVGDKQAGCPVDKLRSCPAEWQRSRFGNGPVVQCRNNKTPQALAFFREGCPNHYVDWNDVQTKVSTVPRQMEVRVGTA